jgi:hypothetical protein
MNIKMERPFEILENAEPASRCLESWSQKYGYTCTRDLAGDWEFIRGTQLQALYSNDIRKTPTTVRVSINDGDPATAHCSIHVRSWLQWSTASDLKRIEEHMELLKGI